MALAPYPARGAAAPAAGEQETCKSRCCLFLSACGTAAGAPGSSWKQCREKLYRPLPQGSLEVVQLDKYEVSHRSHVPLRDLRALDPALAHSLAPSLFFRERAVVLCFEHVKLIVMAAEARAAQVV